MNKPRNIPVKTQAPQQAVQEYLDALLQDATEAALEVPVASPPVVETVVEIAPPQPAVVEVLAEPEPPAAAAEAVPTTATDDLPAPAQRDADSWHQGRPHWAQSRFECLLFKVAGLTLAVPLAELGGVVTMEQELTPLFGQPDWFIGLLPSRGDVTIKTIDTARWVMPEKYTPSVRDGMKYVIRIEGSEWGLACHDVEDAITLEPDQVRWRTDRSRRPWLAGTVIEHMCAIMDVSALAQLIESNNH